VIKYELLITKILTASELQLNNFDYQKTSMDFANSFFYCGNSSESAKLLPKRKAVGKVSE
jgi:hypothetical protein